MQKQSIPGCFSSPVQLARTDARVCGDDVVDEPHDTTQPPQSLLCTSGVYMLYMYIRGVLHKFPADGS